MAHLAASQAGSGKRPRDPRIDFFRGLAFIIIFIAHVPGTNTFKRWLPTNFGWSDATEMFVFMSGYAAAIAYGALYVRRGYRVGTGRVLKRAWEVYLSHLLVFFIILVCVVVANQTFGQWPEIDKDYVRGLNLTYFFQETGRALRGLLTLNYVPNYFDILPMYIVILIMMPVVMAAARVHPGVAVSLCAGLYILTWLFGLGFPAEVRDGSDRHWYFNPLTWQLIFFTGFGLSMGWLRPPGRSRLLMAAAAAVLIFSLAVDYWPLWREFETLTAWNQALKGWRNKTDLGILRYVHFLAAAYLVVLLLRGREHWLQRFGAPIVQCGRQSLPVFMFSMVLSRLCGMALDVFGHDPATQWAVHAGCIGLMIGFAYYLAYRKARKGAEMALGRASAARA